MINTKKCTTENCIPTLSSCVEWNGGEIKSLGICDGDSLNNVIIEIVDKLEELAGEDISSFDIDGLLSICNEKAPLEVTLISILTLLRDNEICLKDYIDTLSDRISEISQSQGVDVNLKCFADIDNLGNELSITRKELDQLVIDELCDHEGRLDNVEGAIVGLQNQINNLDFTPDVTEVSVGTCINSAVLPTSTQIVNTSKELCDLETATGNVTDISSALSNTAGDLNAEFGLIPGWILTPANWAENYNNLLLEVENLRKRLKSIEDNCCAITCDDVKVGVSITFSEDGQSLVFKFTAGAGTNIPNGFNDLGSSGTITDKNGAIEYFTVAIANNAEVDVPISTLDTSAPLEVNITAILGNGAITCERCITKTVSTSGQCDFCEICVDGTEGTVVIVYETDGEFISKSFNPSTTTTTTIIMT